MEFQITTKITNVSRTYLKFPNTVVHQIIVRQKSYIYWLHTRCDIAAFEMFYCWVVSLVSEVMKQNTVKWFECILQ